MTVDQTQGMGINNNNGSKYCRSLFRCDMNVAREAERGLYGKHPLQAACYSFNQAADSGNPAWVQFELKPDGSGSWLATIMSRRAILPAHQNGRGVPGARQLSKAAGSGARSRRVRFLVVRHDCFRGDALCALGSDEGDGSADVLDDAPAAIVGELEPLGQRRQRLGGRGLGHEANIARGQ